MGKLYIYCREPRYAFPDSLYSTGIRPYDDVDALEMPRSREECANGIYNAIMNGNDYKTRGGRYTILPPWKPYNFTNPILPGSPSGEEYLVDCITEANVAYGSVNTPGTFRAKLHPDACYPSIGDYITAFWVEDAEKISGRLVFYGRVTEVENDDGEIDVTAQDVLVTLTDKDQLSVHGITAERGIYHLSLTAGAYMYRDTAFPDETAREPQLLIKNKLYSTYLDGIKDVLEHWYLVTGFRQYIRADGGVIAVCSYDDPNVPIDIIDKSMVSKWRFAQKTDKTYTRVTMTYPVLTSDGSTVTTVQNYHLGTAWNVAFRYAQYLTYSGTAASLDEANLIANHVLKYHGFPTYRITLSKAPGKLHLRPGMLIGVPYVLKGDSVRYLGVGVIRSITHTFAQGSYTMDIIADIDPYDWDINPLPETFEFQKYGTKKLKEKSGWKKRFSLSTVDYGTQMQVRMPRWLRDSLAGEALYKNQILTKSEAEYWETARDMQRQVYVMWDDPQVAFWKIPPETTGQVAVYNNLPVIIPDFKGSQDLDQKDGGKVRETRWFNREHFGIAVLVQHDTHYDCYMMSHSVDEKLPSASAAIYLGTRDKVAPQSTMGYKCWYVMGRFMTASGEQEFPLAFHQTREYDDGTGYYRTGGGRIYIWHQSTNYTTYTDKDGEEFTVRNDWEDTKTDLGPFDTPYGVKGGSRQDILQPGAKVLLVGKFHYISHRWNGPGEYGGAIFPFEAE